MKILNCLFQIFILALTIIFNSNSFVFKWSTCRTKVNSISLNSTDSIHSRSSYEKTRFNRLALAFNWVPIAAVILLKPKRTYAIDTTIYPECSESISVLRRGSSEAVVIGTAHISEESAKLVARTIQKLTPNTVMIELDPKRIGKFSNATTLQSAGFDVPQFAAAPIETTINPRKPNIFYSLIDSIRSIVRGAVDTVTGAVLGTLLQQFYKSVEKLGFTAGGEFKIAVNEARRIGARVLLGDRDVDVTLQKLSVAISSYPSESFDRLLSRLQAAEMSEVRGAPADEIGGDGVLKKEQLSAFVESLKERTTLRQMAATLKEEVPLVYSALIGERDEFMAQSISEANIGSNVLIGVVGMMHLDGVEKALVSTYGYTLVKSACGGVGDSVVTAATIGNEDLANSARLFDVPFIS